MEVNKEILNNNSEQEENSTLKEETINSDINTQNNFGVSQELADLKEEFNNLQDKLLRTAAEAENTRRRYEKMLDEAKVYSIATFAKDLLGVLDNLTRALQHHDAAYATQHKHDNEYLLNIINGVSMIKNELESVFTKYKITQINPNAGDKFDYNIHHAVSQISDTQYEDGEIVNVMQIGYKLSDRLLRPAVVAVAKKSSND